MRNSRLLLVISSVVAMVAALVVATSTTASADSPNVLKVTSGEPIYEGDAITLDANFKVSKKWKLSLWSNVSGEWAKVDGFTGKTASKYGNYKFKDFRVAQTQTVQVRIDGGTDTGDDVTNEVVLEPLDASLKPNPNVLKVTSGEPYFKSDAITLDANFKVSKKWKLSVWSNVSGEWAKVDGFTNKKASSRGNYAFKNFPVTQAQTVQVRIDSGSSETTNELVLDPQNVNIGVPGSDGTLTEPATGYAVGDVLNLTANFASGSKTITLWQQVAGGEWLPVSGAINQKSNSSGDKTFTYEVPDQPDVKVQGRTSTGLLTNIVDIERVVPVVTLSEAYPLGSSRAVPANVAPSKAGRTVELQVQRRYTAETNEVDAINPDAKKKDRVGPWKTIKTAKTNSDGNAVFVLSDPWHVSHKYRVVTGGVESNIRTFGTDFADFPKKSTGLPQVYYNTYENDSVNTRTRYFEGEFSMKAGTSGSSIISQCEDVEPIRYSEMKGRGNYSWSFKKKGYTLKIDERTDLCGMGANKKWALIANHYDKSMMRNMVALHLGRTAFTKMPWNAKAVPVDFYMNGDYRGTYMLVERVSISGDVTNSKDSNRVNIHELKDEGQATNPAHPNNTQPNITGGYLMEWDFRKGADKNITVGSRGYVGLKDPEYDTNREGIRTDEGVSQQQVNYINNYLDDADAAICGSSNTAWKTYLDAGSAVDYYLAMEMLKPIDGNMWASVYMYKPRGGKIFMGPLWDFDLGLGSANRQGNAVSPQGWYLRNMVAPGAAQASKTWFTCLNDKPSFRELAKDRWNEVYNKTSSTDYINSLKSLMGQSASENFKKWKYSERISKVQVFKGSWSQDVEYVKGWMSSRRSWMNSQF